MHTEANASHGIVKGNKEKLVSDLRAVLADADDLLNELAHSTGEGLAAARTKIEDKIGEFRSRVDDARTAVKDKAKGAADATHYYVSENPWKSLGLAAAAGIIIGFLLSRR